MRQSKMASILALLMVAAMLLAACPAPAPVPTGGSEGSSDTTADSGSEEATSCTDAIGCVTHPHRRFRQIRPIDQNGLVQFGDKPNTTPRDCFDDHLLRS